MTKVEPFGVRYHAGHALIKINAKLTTDVANKLRAQHTHLKVAYGFGKKKNLYRIEATVPEHCTHITFEAIHLAILESQAEVARIAHENAIHEQFLRNEQEVYEPELPLDAL